MSSHRKSPWKITMIHRQININHHVFTMENRHKLTISMGFHHSIAMGLCGKSISMGHVQFLKAFEITRGYPRQTPPVPLVIGQQLLKQRHTQESCLAPGDRWWLNQLRKEVISLLVGGLEHQFLIFPYIGDVIIPSDELIFFRGVETANQVISLVLSGISRVNWCTTGVISYFLSVGWTTKERSICW